LQAAHIIPTELGGSDNPTNEIPLSRNLHWAFDRGFFTIDEDYTVKVHPSVLNIELLKNIDHQMSGFTLTKIH
jgi:predicted restriction endonuclease